jgi:hypothetical protein
MRFPNPFSSIMRWWRSHDTVDGRGQESTAARDARFQAEVNRIQRPPGSGG